MRNQETLKAYVRTMQAELHQIPEPAFQEFKTAAFIAGQMKKLGYEVEEQVGGTGVVAKGIGDKPGPCTAVRADMDCIVHESEHGTFYRHSCGHDAHSSIALGVAKKIAGLYKKWNGSIQFIFQPAEETGLGAKALVEAGALKNVDYMIGYHLRPDGECEVGKISPALIHSAATFIRGEIEGKTAHGGRPHLGINVIDVMAAMVTNVNAIKLNPRLAASVKFTQLSTGNGSINSVPGYGSFAIDIRSEDNQQLQQILQEAKNRIMATVALYGARVKIEVAAGIPAPRYDLDLIETAKRSILECLGEEGLAEPIYTPGGEDFHYYSQLTPVRSAYLGIGAGVSPGLHHPKMTFDRDALYPAVQVISRMIENIQSPQ